MVVRDILQRETCWSWYGGLIEDVKAILKSRLEWSISINYKESNIMRHTLAKFGLSLEGE